MPTREQTGVRSAALFILVSLILAISCRQPGNAPEPLAQITDAPSVTLVNGQWFDGSRFTTRTMYMSRGVFTSSPSAASDSIIDLRAGYVVPPFGEAHNHNFEANSAQRARGVVEKYMKDGVFYGQNPFNVLRGRRGLDGFINVPTGIDVTFSNAGITGPGGHPLGLYLRNLNRGVMSISDTNSTGGFIWIIADRADLDRKWPSILASNPDFIKVVLAYSDEYRERLNDSTSFNWRGVDPALVPEIVKRAHASGRRVMAHVETAADFRAALAAGVDQIGHIPGFRGNEQTQLPRLEPYQLLDADAAQAAKQGMFVVTTLGGIVELPLNGPDSIMRRRGDSLFRQNLLMLKKHGVRVIIGSDSYGDTSVPEVMYIASLGVYTNAELLQMWSEETARAIFPKRRIGRFAPGYESSFLVLDADPTQDIANAKRIRLRVKQGITISSPVL